MPRTGTLAIIPYMAALPLFASDGSATTSATAAATSAR